MSTTLVYAGEYPLVTYPVMSVEGTSFVINKTANQLTINGFPVTTTNILCSNGVLHVINQVRSNCMQRWSNF